MTNNKPTGTDPDLERFCFKGGKKKKKKGNPETVKTELILGPEMCIILKQNAGKKI